MAYRHTEKTRARQAAVRERIVAAALDRVAEGGYASASVQAVAARAGVATGTVYRHFPSKADLFAEVFRRATEREVDVVAEVTGGEGPVLERIARAIEAFSRRALAGPVLAYALIAEPVDPAVEAERLRYRHAYRDVFAAALAEGVESRELRPHDSGVVAAALVGALAEALVGPLSPAPEDHRQTDALVANVVQFCVGGIAAETKIDRPVAA
ncbi:MAG TPA: TetR/AcrR family transcriptional regulator [Thermoleophilaceae bacterium]